MSDSLKTAYTAPSANAAQAINYHAPDLRVHPPRSPRTRLGGYVQLPRLLDKARAVAAGKQGDFHYNCPIDERFFAFTGIEPAAMFAEIASGKSDSEMLAYVQASTKRQPSEIFAWSQWFEQLAPSSADSRAFFTDVHRKNAPQRTDIATWFEWLELDDYVTYGGKA